MGYRTYFTFIFLCLSLSINGQELNPGFRSYFIEDGLSQSTVYAIHKDKTGFVWLGTRDGLNRFDGQQFKHFYPDVNNPNALSNRTIRAISETPDGILWIGTDGGGVDRFNPYTGDFENICKLEQQRDCIENLHVLSLWTDGSLLWIGTRNNGLLKYDMLSGTLIKVLSASGIWEIKGVNESELFLATEHGFIVLQNGVPTTYLGNEDVRALYVDDELHKIWTGTVTNGLFLFDTITRTIERHPEKALSQLTKHPISSISKTGNHYWIGTLEDGILLFSPSQTEEWVKYDRYNPKSIAGNAIRNLYKDNTGMMWIGTNSSGFSNYSPFRFLFRHIAGNAENLVPESNSVLCFEELASGEIIVGTERGGLFFYNPKTSEIWHPAPSKETDFIVDGSIIDLLYDAKHQLWIGTENGLFLNKKGDIKNLNQSIHIKGLTNEAVISVLELGEDEILVGTYYGLNRVKNGIVEKELFNGIDSLQILHNVRILSLYKDQEGHIWIGSYDQGIYKVNMNTKKMVNFRYGQNSANGLLSNRIQSFSEDKAGRLWVGTYNGLYQYSKDSKSFSTYLKEDGLPNNVVYGILESDEGELWLSTNYGLSRFNPEKRSYVNYTVYDGLQSSEFNGGAYFKMSDGSLLFGGINGFNSFTPSKILSNNIAPKTKVLRFIVEGEEQKLTTGQDIKLNFRQNFFLFEVAALDFNKPGKLQYQYKLTGISDDWINLGYSRTVNFTGLKPGNYIFTARGGNGDGVWGKPSEPVHFSIFPPFWATPQFQFGVVFLMLFSGYLFYRYRMYFIMKEHETRNRIARDLHDDLSSTLSSISFFSEAIKRAGKGDESSKYLHLIENSTVEAKEKINDIIWSVSTENDNWLMFINKCKRYIADSLDTRGISYVIDFDEIKIDKISLPLRQNLWLILKEIISNLVRHSHATHVEVTFKREKDDFCLTIIDNGIGFNLPEVKAGNGLKNIRYRTQLIHGILTVHSFPEEGTSFILRAKI